MVPKRLLSQIAQRRCRISVTEVLLRGQNICSRAALGFRSQKTWAGMLPYRRGCWFIKEPHPGMPERGSLQSDRKTAFCSAAFY
jgi:hypothetical protein